MRDVKCRFFPILKERLNTELFCSLGMVMAVVVVAVVAVVVVVVILSNQDDLNLMD